MKNILIIAVIGVVLYFVFAPSDNGTGAAPGIDLERVLDITANTLSRDDSEVPPQNDARANTAANAAGNTVDNGAAAAAVATSTTALNGFRDQLQLAYNSATPPLYSQPLGVAIDKDGKIVGYADPNANATQEGGEKKLFTIEVDGEKQRLIATDTSGVARDHGFSGTGLLTGMLIGSLLSRQSSAGIRPSSLSNRSVSSSSNYRSARSAAASRASAASARSRSGSGSHRSGK
jgi:hypothetical protein